MKKKASSALNQLGLKVASAQLDSVAQQAASSDWSYTHFLGYLLDGEMTERHRKMVELSLKLSHLPCVKRLADFDFSAQPGIRFAALSMSWPLEDSFMKEEILFFWDRPVLAKLIWPSLSE